MFLTVNTSYPSQNAPYRSNVTHAKNNATKQDSFQPQKSYEPAFGTLNKVKIFKCCDELLSETNKLTNIKDIGEAQEDILDKLMMLINEPKNISKSEENFYKSFGHEFVTSITPSHSCLRVLLADMDDKFEYIDAFYPKKLNLKTETQKLKFFKNLVKKFTTQFKEGIYDWKSVELWWGKPDLVVSSDKVLARFVRTAKKIPKKHLSIKGIELLENMSFENPGDICDAGDQLFNNAIKYRNNGPVEVSIEKKIKNGKDFYTASFTNPNFPKYSDAQIDRIIVGDGHRAPYVEEAKIYGTGYGIPRVIEILKTNGLKDEIPNLFEKNRDYGVKTSIPLIGIRKKVLEQGV